MRIKTTSRAVIALLLGFTLAACGTWDEMMTSEPVDYKSTVRGEPLSLPPDLSRAQINPTYSTQNGRASASAYNKAVANAERQRQAGQHVLPENAAMQVMSSGDAQWLRVDLKPGQVYPELLAFWNEQGFTINRDNPTAGIIETDWAENRAKIPANFLRRVLGSVVDMISDSGERERFITRLERVNGKTEIHIGHERMVETQMTRDGSTFKWLPAAEDPNLNAIMLSRLMTYLGASKDQAQAALANPQTSKAKQYKATLMASEVVLAFNATPENTYRQLGHALSVGGFTIEKADPSAQSYTILYLDTDTGEKREAANSISRLWGDKGNLSPLPYVIFVKGKGNESAVVVRNQEGNIDRSNTAYRILTVIRDNL